MRAPAEIRIGTSGWHYPTGRGTWNGVFYPAHRPRGFDELAYYAEHFDTVEVNATFYRQPEPGLSAGWLRRTPPGFLFSVKLFQKFTHPDMYLARARTADWDVSRADVDVFRAGIDPLADAGRLGAVLIQFPSSFHAEPDTRAYLDWLLGVLDGYPLAVELRHRSWREASVETARQIAERGASWVRIDDPTERAGRRSGEGAVAPEAGDRLLYVRLHGRNAANWWTHEAAEDRYDYLYSAGELQPFAADAREAAAAGRRVFLYLNNHFSAKAVANAAVLKRELDQPVPGTYPPEMAARYPALAGIIVTEGLPL